MKSFKSLLVSLIAVVSPILVQAAPNGALINPNADADTRALMSLLMKNYGSRTLSGQSDVSFSNWIQQSIGKTPALSGFDFMDYSPSRVAFGSSSTDVEKAIAWSNRGGIVAFCWHWGSPNGAYNSATQPWYSNFYTAATGFDVAAAMNSPGSTNYNLLIRDIDAIAALLKRLQSAGVPVLWRPLHEAGGTWFWWGAKGPDACKKLWRLMYDRMTYYHKLNNLIWVWNWEDAAWYPGNSAVDIVSTDIYASASNHDAQAAAFNRLKALSGDSKIIAMAENGVIPNFSTAAPWSFWMTWNGNFITDGVSNSKSFLTSIFNSQSVLTLDEIPGWKSGGGGGNPPNPVTTTRAVTTARPTTTAGNIQPGGAPLYGQCGGQG